MSLRIFSMMFNLLLVAGVLGSLSAPAYGQRYKTAHPGHTYGGGSPQADKEILRKSFNAKIDAATAEHTRAYNKCLRMDYRYRKQCTEQANDTYRAQQAQIRAWKFNEEKAIDAYWLGERQGFPQNRSWQPGKGQQGTLVDNNVTKKNPKLDNKPRGQYKRGAIVYGKNPAPSKDQVVRYKPDGHGGWKRVE